jgi:glycosyltransferase involved in cell wall biosynthesis
MPRVVHIVTTAQFAGVERYVCEVAAATAACGWEVAVVGGDSERMPAAVGDGVRWEPGGSALESLRSVLRLGRTDITHAHMTVAEAIAVATRPVHRAVIVSTRHFAARRGKSRAGRVAAPWIAKHVTREIAASEFVARHLERPPAEVVLSGVSESACLWRAANRIVLVLQRLEPEKDTLTALVAWQASRLLAVGWSMRIVGDGSQRRELERRVESESIDGVEFAGWTDNVAGELSRAGILLAPTAAEALGLSVLEAMAAGVPVVASGSGGHLETIGAIEGAPLFPPGDASAAATALRALRADSVRARMSAEGRRVVAERFTIERHVDRLLSQYAAARAGAVPIRRECVSEGSP